jgi:nicotinate-nucleotide pyrophosphorylase (carboxylating)
LGSIAASRRRSPAIRLLSMSNVPARPRPPVLTDFISAYDLAALVHRTREEDMSPAPVDLTSEWVVPPQAQATAVIRARGAGVLAGAATLPTVTAAYDLAIKLADVVPDGSALTKGSVVAHVGGPLRSLLAMERVALNFLTHLSGIASVTRRYVDAIDGTRARIYDTRKTLPGLRGIEKYAVVCGGGCSHRLGLYDAVLVKDNHIAHLSLDELPATVRRVVATAKSAAAAPRFVQVEVDTLAQLRAVLPCGVQAILLDNRPPEVLRQAVKIRDELAPRVELEASGGVTLASVRTIAETGVERISIGALTHSAPALDIGMDIESSG